MKYVKKFENYRVEKHREEIIKESVLQVNDIYKVKTMIDIPQSLINAYVKKVRETTGNNLRQFFGDIDIAEEIVKFINTNNLDIEKIPGGALMGGQETAQDQGQEQPAPQAQTQPAPQVQPQAEAQPAAQVQVEAQPAVQTEAQPQVQVEAQPQAQPAQGEFEEPAQGEEEEEKEEGEEESENNENEEELPL